MDVLKSCAHLERTYSTVPRFPAVRRDLSLVVDEETTWAQIQEVLTAIDQPLRTDVQYVTTYRGTPITAGRKSVTLTVVYQSNDATLRSEQVDEQITEIVTALAGALKAEVRT
jgi:phenylalanyl-tRNA synthetase beta chain